MKTLAKVVGSPLAVLAVVYLLMRRIDGSPYGRVLRAIREDAQVAQVAGKPVLRFKVQAFSLSAAIAGLAGALYGHFTSYIAPDLFLPLITIYIFLSVASGGVGRPTGALVGALMVGIFDTLARVLIPLVLQTNATSALVGMAVYVLMAVVLLFSRTGLFAAHRG